MICTKCNSSIPDGTKFCPQCGERIAAAAPQISIDAPTLYEKLIGIKEGVATSDIDAAFGAPKFIVTYKEACAMFGLKPSADTRQLSCRVYQTPFGEFEVTANDNGRTVQEISAINTVLAKAYPSYRKTAEARAQAAAEAEQKRQAEEQKRQAEEQKRREEEALRRAAEEEKRAAEAAALAAERLKNAPPEEPAPETEKQPEPEPPKTKPVLQSLGTVRQGNNTYEGYKASTAEEAKLYLSMSKVTQPLYYIVVESPEGTWGLDKDGMYMENLLPYQTNLSLAQCEGKCSVFGKNTTIMAVQMAAKGISDNFIDDIECGSCGHKFEYGIRYQNKTVVRCPGCGKFNLIDSSHIKFMGV